MEHKTNPEANLTISYEGITEARADVILPSLIAFVELLKEVAGKVSQRKKPEIIILEIREGSFVVDFNIVLDVVQKLLDIVVSLITIKLFLENRKPQYVEEGAQTTIVNHEGKNITVDAETYSLARDKYLDRQLYQFAEPLAYYEGLYHENLIVKIKSPYIRKVLKTEILNIQKGEIKLDKGALYILSRPSPLLQNMSQEQSPEQDYEIGPSP